MGRGLVKGLILSVLASVLVVSALLMGASCSCDGEAETASMDEYTIADPTGDWGYPSPYAHYSRGPGYTRMSFVFDTLVWKDDEGLISALAKDWEYGEADKVYTFELEEDVKWHDGEKFTADDVVFTFEYTKDHPYQWVDNTIVSSAEAADEYTVKLYLTESYAAFLTNIAGTQPILPKHIWEGVDAPEEFTGEEAVIGTGPYRIIDYSKEHGTYLFERFDDYYQGKPMVKTIKFVKVSEEMTPAALQDGSVSYGSINPEMAQQMQSAGLELVAGSYNWNAKMMINHTKGPLSSKEFRQALAYAIDRENLVDVTQQGNGMAGSPGLIPQDSEWYNSNIEQYEYDPDKAKQLLENLGYTLDDGQFKKDGENLELELIAPSEYKDLGQFIEQDLEDIGIDVEFKMLDVKAVDANVEAWEFDLSIYGHGGLHEPSILNKVIVGKGFNSARYTANSTLNQLLEDQLMEMDEEDRADLVDEIQRIYAEEVPALTLYYPDFYSAHDGTVDLYYTEGGIASGIPIPLNKMSFVG
jgi:peptide/nickel transport system substrate-binding protein